MCFTLDNDTKLSLFKWNNNFNNSAKLFLLKEYRILVDSIHIVSEILKKQKDLWNQYNTYNEYYNKSLIRALMLY